MVDKGSSVSNYSQLFPVTCLQKRRNPMEYVFPHRQQVPYTQLDLKERAQGTGRTVGEELASGRPVRTETCSADARISAGRHDTSASISGRAAKVTLQV